MDRIQIIGDTTPAISQGFRDKLRAQDPTLTVSWNWKKRRFVIEQCVRHHASTAEHNHLCERIYVLLVQDPDGGMLALGDHVLEEIRRRDIHRAGYGPNDLGRFTRDMQAKLEDHQQKIDAAQADAVHHASRVNRRQLLRAISMMQNHSLEVNQ